MSKLVSSIQYRLQLAFMEAGTLTERNEAHQCTEWPRDNCCCALQELSVQFARTRSYLSAWVGAFAQRTSKYNSTVITWSPRRRPRASNSPPPTNKGRVRASANVPRGKLGQRPSPPPLHAAKLFANLICNGRRAQKDDRAFWCSCELRLWLEVVNIHELQNTSS